MKKHLILLLLGFALCNSACMFIETKTFQDDKIDADIKAEIAPLNKQIFNSLMTRNVGGIKKLMSPQMLDSAGTTIDTIVNTVANTYKGKEYKILDEFYTKNAIPGKRITLISNKGNINNYTIEYGVLNRETYVSLMVSQNLPINFAVLTVFGKYDDKWKLNILSVNDYSILDKTAPEYYATALQQFRKGDTIDAALNIITASAVGHPGGKHLKYQDDDDMQTFYTSTIAEANAAYHFPIPLKQIKTGPELYAIVPKLITDKKQQGIYPVIKYMSKIKITDTVALKQENNAVQKAVGSMFKGITEDKNYILYDAFNELPNGKASPNYYVFIQKLK